MGRLSFADCQTDTPLLRARVSFYENSTEILESRLKKFVQIFRKQIDCLSGSSIYLFFFSFNNKMNKNKMNKIKINKINK